MSNLTNRLAKLEHAQRGISLTEPKGAFLVGYVGPEDDEKLAAAMAKAEATGMRLIVLEAAQRPGGGNEQVE